MVETACRGRGKHGAGGQHLQIKQMTPTTELINPRILDDPFENHAENSGVKIKAAGDIGDFEHDMIEAMIRNGTGQRHVVFLGQRSV